MIQRRLSGRLVGLTAGIAALPGLLLLTGGGSAGAAPRPTGPQAVPQSVKDLGTARAGIVAPALRKATGTVAVSVALSEQPVAAAVPADATRTGNLPSRAAQRSRTASVQRQQDQVIGKARALGARELGRASKAANVVAVQIPASKLTELAKIAGVVSVKPIATYHTTQGEPGSGSLAQAAQYLGAESLRASGIDGTGVKIGVLDSGVDFTHKNLGGPGTVAAYEQCFAGAKTAPVGECAALFGPTAPKVKGGIDFVGDKWDGTKAGGKERPDPNPIDSEGHGTHVSDIAAGRSTDGSHLGIAPGADLFVVKVCSSVSTACSGVAILSGVDWALDPNGDGDISDAVDVMNLSLGADYGQPEDDSALALQNAVRAGVVVVASAGNGSDRPFKVGSPSTAPGVISVAETALPDDKLYPITVNSPTIPGLPGNQVRYAFALSWAPVPTTPITGPLSRPTGNILGCSPADWAGFPAGAVALAARGSCAAAQKARNAQNAGASAIAIYNNLPGDPYPFAFDGGSPITIPSLSIRLDRGRLLAAALASGPVNVTIDPADAIALTNTVVASSSRGPRIDGATVKPDIGAPGAWLSAEVGTGAEETKFGGTSGAAPVITGAAALLLDKFPAAGPAQIKSRLLNGASTENRTPDADANLYPTPITRVGAGEVRIDAAAGDGVLINTQMGNGNVSLGLPHPATTSTRYTTLLLRNTSSEPMTYRLEPQFRDPADAATGAVQVLVPAVVSVPPQTTQPITMAVTIEPSKLPTWPFTRTAGATGDGAQLNAPEVDGYVQAVAGNQTLHLGWQVLPHRSAAVQASDDVEVEGQGGRLTLRNSSTVLDGVVDVYGLTGSNGKLPTPMPGEPGSPGSNAAVIDLAAAGVRDDVANDVIQFAIAGQNRQTIPLYPAGYEVDIDTNRDKKVDYAVFQLEAGGPATSGLSVVYVFTVATQKLTAYFFNEADFDSATEVFAAPLSALGLTAGDTFDFDLLAFDNYFTGNVTDVIRGMSWTVGSTKFSVTSGAEFAVPAGGRVTVGVAANSGAGESTESGLLLLYSDAAKADFQAVPVS